MKNNKTLIKYTMRYQFISILLKIGIFIFANKKANRDKKFGLALIVSILLKLLKIGIFVFANKKSNRDKNLVIAVKNTKRYLSNTGASVENVRDKMKMLLSYDSNDGFE